MTKLVKKNYRKYVSKRIGDKSFFEYFRSVMPEILSRTTKLEGEKVDRRFVSSLFVSNNA